MATVSGLRRLYRQLDASTPITREFELPYIKRTYSSNSSSQRLKDFKWTEWVSGRIDKIINETESGCSLSAQFRDFAKTEITVPRRDTRLGGTMDVFYHHQHERAIKWQQGNDEGLESRMPHFANMIVAFGGARTIWT